jgi:hypothetical protein
MICFMIRASIRARHLLQQSVANTALRAVERLVGRPVDLVETKAMADSRLKRVIERTQVPVYEQAA